MCTMMLMNSFSALVSVLKDEFAGSFYPPYLCLLRVMSVVSLPYLVTFDLLFIFLSLRLTVNLQC